MISFVQEVAHSLHNNKLRTALTAFAIAWGIFMLIVLLGVGRGVQKGITQTTALFRSNDIKIHLRHTEKAYGGYQAGRRLQLDDRQIASLRALFKESFRVIDPIFSASGIARSSLTQSNTSLRSYSVEELHCQGEQIIRGRHFTDQELINGERVIVLSEKEAPMLFPGGVNPIGQSIIFNNMSFVVVGIKKETSLESITNFIPLSVMREMMPNSTLQTTTIKVVPHAHFTNKESNKLLKLLKAEIERMLIVSPEDEYSVFVRNDNQNEEFEKVFKGIDTLLWIIGLSSLTIGIVGVSNIMQVTVQERMKEIGIRKAIGAKPLNILTMVLGESIFISVISGVIGFVAGYAALKFVGVLSNYFEWGQQALHAGDNITFTLSIFASPSVDMGIALGALIVLIITGIIAGYAPAIKAIRIPAVTAMRDFK